MANDLILGLRISALGLAVTFLAMGLVILVMYLLMRLFPIKKVVQGGTAEAKRDLSKSMDGPETADEQALEEMAVALAVGICLLEQEGALRGEAPPVQREPTLGKLLEE
jgi:hypothetical protein